jgi:hypothetical protein
MAVDDEIPETEDEWQFAEEVPTFEPPAGGLGGGLLQQILDEVSTLRTNADADRAALADALNGAFGRLETELEVLREQVAAVRAELDASGMAMTNALAEVIKAVAAEEEVDVPAVVEEIVSTHLQANVEAVVEALGPHLAALRKALPTADTARIAMEVTRLRHSLIGPDQK